MASHPDTGPRLPRLTRLLMLSSILLLQAVLTVGQAQMTLDGSLGPRGPLTGPNYRIGAELGQIRGGNLFHSFEQFNVPSGGSATFTGPTTIANILSRVTGGQPSAIDGLLRSEIAGANLYLLNPSGVLFGPNAALNVSGSFHVSTADYLRFTDGATFSANLGQESVLTVASPMAFGFLGSNPAGIIMQGSSLTVAGGKALSVVGGDITIKENGALTVDSTPLGAPKGRIQLVSVASPGEVVFSRLELAPELHVQGFTRLGRLDLLDGTHISSHGSDIVMHAGSMRLIGGLGINSSGSGPQPGGDVAISVTDSIITASRPGPMGCQCVFAPFISSGSFFSGPGGGDSGRIAISASTIQHDAGSISSNFPGRHGGDIDLRGGTLALAGGHISAGNKGTVTATDSITLSGSVTSIAGSGFASGISGPSVAISAPILSLKGQASIGAGNLDIRVNRLSLLDGAVLSASAGFFVGPAGGITVTATDSIVISGHRSYPYASGPSFTPSQITAVGSNGRVAISTPSLHMDEGLIGTDTLVGFGGDVEVNVDRLTLTGGARITSSNLGGPGQGGSVRINATESVMISGSRLSVGVNDIVPAGRIPSGVFSQTTISSNVTQPALSGDGGRVVITAPRLIMADGSRIATDTGVNGRGGDMQVEVGRLSLTSGAQITSSSGIMAGNTLLVGTGQGGRITIAAEDGVSISGQNSGIFSETKGPGRGGGIALQAAKLRLTDGAMISAMSFGLGNAGNLDLAATEMSLRDHSTITTAAAQASGGNIALRAGSRLLLEDSTLSASVAGGPETVGGTLTINAPFIISQGSQLIANAFAGQGGTISLGAEVFLADPASQVSASSDLGISGTVDIQAPVTSLSGTLAPLSQAVVSAAALLPARCAARWSGGKASSLVLGGRDGLPVDPGGLLPSPLVLEELLVADPTVTEALQHQLPTARFGLLASQEKVLPRLGCSQ